MAHDARNHKASSSTAIAVASTRYESKAIEVPSYANFNSLSSNILVENEDKLVVWPYFESGMETSEDELYEELHHRYKRGTPKEREGLLYRRSRAQTWMYSILDGLEELGCTMQDVQRYLLEPDPVLEFPLRTDAQKAWNDRQRYCTAQGFDRAHPYWVRVLSNLPLASKRGMAFAGLACAAFLKLCNFDLWHLAKLEFMQPIATLNADRAINSRKTFPPQTCRLCHLHDCPYHGLIELCDDGDSNMGDLPSDEEDADAANFKRHVVTPYDIVSSFARIEQNPDTAFRHDGDDPCSSECFLARSMPKIVAKSWSDNELVELRHYLACYRGHPRSACCIAPIFSRSCMEIYLQSRRYPTPNNQSHVHPQPEPIKRDWRYWMAHTKTHMNELRAPFFPCHHEGSCENAKCRCFTEKITCEKTCSCPKNCSRRYQGCSCQRTGRICWHSNKCDCFRLGRECDPDLCETCGADEVLNPIRRRETDVMRGRCSNTQIQRNIPKRTLLGHSGVAGFGLYAGERIRKNDYIGEYKGEILSKDEADRRGSIYHYRSTNYLFKLNTSMYSRFRVDTALLIDLKSKMLIARWEVIKLASSITRVTARTSTVALIYCYATQSRD